MLDIYVKSYAESQFCTLLVLGIVELCESSWCCVSLTVSARRLHRMALRVALSVKYAQGNMLIVDNFNVNSISTRRTYHALRDSGVLAPTLFVPCLTAIAFFPTLCVSCLTATACAFFQPCVYRVFSIYITLPWVCSLQCCCVLCFSCFPWSTNDSVQLLRCDIWYVVHVRICIRALCQQV